MTTPGPIFLSYSSQDRSYVDRLVNALQSQGVPVWYDPAIEPGARYIQVIEEALDACSGVIVVMTRASKASRWVESECEAAQKRGKPIIPFLLEDGGEFLQFVSTRHVDVRGGQLPTPAVLDLLRRVAAGQSVTLPRAATPASSVAGASSRRAGVVALVVVLVLAILGGAAYVGTRLAHPGDDAASHPPTPTAPMSPTDAGNSTAATSPTVAAGPVERLAGGPVTRTAGPATFTVGSVTSGDGVLVVTMAVTTTEAIYFGNDFQLQEQPSGTTLPVDHFTVLSSVFQYEVVSGAQGTLEFPGTIDPGTSSLRLTFVILGSAKHEVVIDLPVG